MNTAEVGTYDSEMRIFTNVNLLEITFKIYVINSYGIGIMHFGKVFLLT